MKKLLIIFSSIALTTVSLFAHVTQHPFDNQESFQRYQHKTQDTHYLLGVAIDGRCIELEDRTTWKIPRAAYNILKGLYGNAAWKKGDPIFVTPNTSWFCRGEYQHDMRNLRTGATIPVKFDTLPDPDGPYTKFLQAFIPQKGRIILVNNYKATFSFDVNPQDLHIMHNWEINDPIFVATNAEGNWFGEPSHTMLLINPETLTQVRVNE